MSDHLNEFCRQRYDYEAQRRGELTGAVAMPVGVLSVLGGALFAILKDLHAPLRASELVLLVSAVLCLLACLVSAAYLARSYFGYTYRYVATPKQVRDHHTGIKTAYVTAGGAGEHATAFADARILEYIQERYAESAHHNTLINDKKSWFLHRANGAMLAALLPAVAAGVAFLIVALHSAPSTTKVEVLNVDSFLKKENCDGNRDAQRSACTTAPAASEPDAAAAAAGSIHKGASGPNEAASR